MRSLLHKYWAVVVAVVCVAVMAAGAALWVHRDSRRPVPGPAPRELADLSAAELSQFLPNAADVPEGWGAQQDAADPGISEILGGASRPSCSERPDQVAARAAVVSSRAHGPKVVDKSWYPEVSMALIRGNAGAGLQERTRRWVADCDNITMHYRGTGLCQAALHPVLLPNLVVGTVTATRIKIVSTNGHCLRGGAEPDSSRTVGVAVIGGLTLVAQNDKLSDLGEPLMKLTLQRLQNYSALPAPSPDALTAGGPTFMALAPSLAQTSGNGRWFVDQWTSGADADTAAPPMATEPTKCEPFPFPGGYGLPIDQSLFSVIGSIHVLRYGTDPKNGDLQGDTQAQYFREHPGSDVLTSVRSWAKRCQQYQIVSGQPCGSHPVVQVDELPADKYRADDAIGLRLDTANWCGDGTRRFAVVTLLRVRGVLLVTRSSESNSATDWLLSTAIDNLRKVR